MHTVPATSRVATLYSDHHGWLQGWLRRRLGCAHRAADVAHDTFLRIIASRDAMLGVQEPRAWLTTTAQRLLIDQSRRSLLEQTWLAEMMSHARELPGHPSPDEVLMAVQALTQISTALEGMSARVRETFLRHYLDEQTQADIAADLGVSKRMVQKYLVQALLSCRRHCPALSEHGC